MQAYPTSLDESSLDWQATIDYALDVQRFPVPTMTLNNCRNPLCTQQSYALYCSPACLAAVEPEVLDEPADDADYYPDPDSNTLLGHIATASHQAALDGDLVRKALGMPQAVPAAVVPTVLSEAGASATVRLEIAGHKGILFTVRDHDETRLLERLEQTPP